MISLICGILATTTTNKNQSPNTKLIENEIRLGEGQYLGRRNWKVFNRYKFTSIYKITSTSDDVMYNMVPIANTAV